jgi:hypothetical protein
VGIPQLLKETSRAVPDTCPRPQRHPHPLRPDAALLPHRGGARCTRSCALALLLPCVVGCSHSTACPLLDLTHRQPTPPTHNGDSRFARAQASGECSRGCRGPYGSLSSTTELQGHGAREVGIDDAAVDGDFDGITHHG